MEHDHDAEGINRGNQLPNGRRYTVLEVYAWAICRIVNRKDITTTLDRLRTMQDYVTWMRNHPDSIKDPEMIP